MCFFFDFTGAHLLRKTNNPIMPFKMLSEAGDKLISLVLLHRVNIMRKSIQQLLMCQKIQIEESL